MYNSSSNLFSVFFCLDKIRSVAMHRELDSFLNFSFRSFPVENKCKVFSAGSSNKTAASKDTQSDCNQCIVNAKQSSTHPTKKVSTEPSKKPTLKSFVLSPVTAISEIEIKREILSDDIESVNSNDTSMQLSTVKQSKQTTSNFRPNSSSDETDTHRESYSPKHKPLTTCTPHSSNGEGMLAKTTNVSEHRQSSRERKRTKKKSRHRSSSRKKSNPSEKRRRKSRSANQSDRNSSTDREYSSSRTSLKLKRKRDIRSYRSSSSSSRGSVRCNKEKKRSRKTSVSKKTDKCRGKKDWKNCACNCDCQNSCKKSIDKHSKDRPSPGSKSPSTDDTKRFNYNSITSSYASQRELSSSIDRQESDKLDRKKHLSVSNEHASKQAKKATASLISATAKELNKKYLPKPQPIVKLHSSPNTDDSDSEPIDREYEELLTFETNEDERREQRLLKALSDIAAKAKQKIQSITESSNSNAITSDNNHNDSSSRPGYAIKAFKESIKKSTSNSEDRMDKSVSSHYDDDYSPRSRYSSKRSRRDDESSRSWKSALVAIEI